jgi:CRP-like cAMP-binding protein
MVNLKQLYGFRQFMSFNGIDEESLKLSLKCLSHLLVHKGCYVFKQEEPSTHFYGILKGRISIRINKVDKQKKKEYLMNKLNRELLKRRTFAREEKKSSTDVLEERRSKNIN